MFVEIVTSAIILLAVGAGAAILRDGLRARRDRS